MINTILKYGLISVVLILLQILVLNNIQFSGYVNPYVYIMIILILPSLTPSWLILLIAFFTGLVIDLFFGSPGMHASATLIAGFARPFVLRIIAPRDGYDLNGFLRIQVVRDLCYDYCPDSPYKPLLYRGFQIY